MKTNNVNDEEELGQVGLFRVINTSHYNEGIRFERLSPGRRLVERTMGRRT